MSTVVAEPRDTNDEERCAREAAPVASADFGESAPLAAHAPRRWKGCERTSQPLCVEEPHR